MCIFNRPAPPPPLPEPRPVAPKPEPRAERVTVGSQRTPAPRGQQTTEGERRRGRQSIRSRRRLGTSSLRIPLLNQEQMGSGNLNY